MSQVLIKELAQRWVKMLMAQDYPLCHSFIPQTSIELYSESGTPLGLGDTLVRDKSLRSRSIYCIVIKNLSSRKT